jgi:dihydrofolate synthase / folylpolyglutamate synthase
MSVPAFLTEEDIYRYFLSFVNVEKGQATEFKLDRMRSMADRLGNPERFCPCIHVAGSKGKGSVSAMLGCILEASGRKTGLYTSPHILDYRERTTRAGVFFPDKTFLDAFSELAPLVVDKEASDFEGGELPTFFELSTLLAFLIFRKERCDAAVYETGLGGRLDSTNIVTPEASVLTTIELEHTEFLGATIPQIAAEKAGIVKPGVPVFTSARNPMAMSVFRAAARLQGCKLSVLAEEVALSDIQLSREGTCALATFRDREVFPEPVLLRTPMIGEIQIQNAALAALVARRSSFQASPEAVLTGISKAQLLARFQILPGDPTIVLDGAHTPASMEYTVSAFNSLFPGQANLVFACAQDKNHAEMARVLSPHFESVIVTKPGTFKQSDPGAAAESFRGAGFAVEQMDDTEEALDAGLKRAINNGRPLLIVGSFYLCAEALKRYQNRV